jgi:hypothetical protein
MRARAFVPTLSFALGCAAACGAPPAPPKTSDKAAEGTALPEHDRAASELAAKQGGLGSLGPGNAEQGPSLAGPLTAYAFDKSAPVKLDGLLKEWPARANADRVVTGSPDGTKLQVGLQYDGNLLYVAAEITDAEFVRSSAFKPTEDRLMLKLAFPEGAGLSVYEIDMFAGKPGESVGAVKFAAGPKKGQDVPGAKIVEAPAAGGYTLEASIPFATFPEATTTRVGLRGVLAYHDAGKAGPRGIVASATFDPKNDKSLPALPTEAEHGVVEGLLEPRGLAQKAPLADVYADVTGDAMKERISVFGSFVVVCGPGYRGGKQFFFRDLGAELGKLEASRATGRDKADLVITRRATAGGTTHEWLEVWSFLQGDEPKTVFAQEVRVANGSKSIANRITFGDKTVEVRPEPAVGWDESSFREGAAEGAEPLLLPWGPTQRRAFRFDGSRFALAAEDTAPRQPAPKKPTPPTQEPTPAPQAPTPKVDTLAQYMKDRAVPEGTKPTALLNVQLAGDAKPEQVALVGRDLIAFGPGINQGQGYTFVSLSQLDQVQGIEARDLTGDGRAEVLVRGRMKTEAPKGETEATISVLVVYEFRTDRFARIFATKTAIETKDKKVETLVQFVPAKGGKGVDVVTRPGAAKGFTEATFPWSLEKPGTGSLEPLLLPWGGIAQARYSYDGSGFRFSP